MDLQIEHVIDNLLLEDNQKSPPFIVGEDFPFDA